MTTLSYKHSYGVRLLELADARIKGMVNDKYEELGESIADAENRSFVTACVESSRIIWDVIGEILDKAAEE